LQAEISEPVPEADWLLLYREGHRIWCSRGGNYT